MATRTPADWHFLAVSVQYGMTFSFHCHSSISRYSGGHGAVIQLGCFADGSPPGQPLNVITCFTPSLPASWTVCSNTAWWSPAIFGSGWIGFP